MITSPFSRVPSRGHIRPTDPSTSVRDHVVAEIHPYLPRGTRQAGTGPRHRVALKARDFSLPGRGGGRWAPLHSD